MKNSFNLLEIPTNTSYWLVRASGGKFFEDFLENEFVSIAHNEIKISDFPTLDDPHATTLISLKSIKSIYSKKYPEAHPNSLTTISKQAYNFVYDMKIDDLVITPSKRSDKFAIGIIKSDPYDENTENIEQRIKNAVPNGINYSIDKNIKRRKIQWLKIISRTEIPKELFWVYSAHQTIFNLSKFSKYFDRLLSPVYLKDDKITVNIHVAAGQDLTVQQFTDFNYLIKKITDADLNKIKLETDVHSPGFLTLILDVNNLNTAVEIINFICRLTSEHPNASVAVSTLPFLPLVEKSFKLIFGENVFKKGILNWFKDLSDSKEMKESKDLDIKQKQQEVVINQQKIELNELDIERKKIELEKSMSSMSKENMDKSSVENSDDSPIENVLKMNLVIRDEGNFVSHDHE